MKSKTPVSIRFDLEQIEFIMTKEKLSSEQKVVNFLLNKYWWENKIAVPTHDRVPPLHLRVEQGEDKKQSRIPAISNKSVEEFLSWKRSCESLDEYSILLQELEKSDHLSSKQKSLIKNA